jgi:hypothetical protein
MARTPEDDILQDLIRQLYLASLGRLGERDNALIGQKAKELGLATHKIYELKLEVQRDSEDLLKDLLAKAAQADEPPTPPAKDKPKADPTPKVAPTAKGKPKAETGPQPKIEPKTTPPRGGTAVPGKPVGKTPPRVVPTTKPPARLAAWKLALGCLVLGGGLASGLWWWLGRSPEPAAAPQVVATDTVRQPPPRPKVAPPPSLVGYYQGKVRGKVRRLRIRHIFPDSTLRYGLVRPGRETAWLPGKLQGQAIELTQLGRGKFWLEGDRYVLRADDGKWAFERLAEIDLEQ